VVKPAEATTQAQTTAQETPAAEQTTPKKAGALATQLEETDMGMLVDELISRKDGLHHLLLSDVNALLQRIASEFSDIAQIGSIGQSTQGRDINYITLDANPSKKDKPAILITGATHARELISTSFGVYQMLKLLKKGVVEKQEKYQTYL
jgi:murein tripeptide amidase MpaA